MVTSEVLLEKIEGIICRDDVHNVNFVTPDHFFPDVIAIIGTLRKRGYTLPAVLNLSGYQSPKILGMVGDYADIYLPDYKYSDRLLAASLSKCPEYPSVALEAISMMVHQKGFLDSFVTGRPIASRGVLARHLILPGRIDNSLNALTALFVEFGKALPLSIMSQYYPVDRSGIAGDLSRFITPQEFGQVYDHAINLGFEHLFVQFPQDTGCGEGKQNRFLPDFRLRQPFGSRVGIREGSSESLFRG
jgi:putative pyruvate formate lyase activating enzyme